MDGGLATKVLVESSCRGASGRRLGEADTKELVSASAVYRSTMNGAIVICIAHDSVDRCAGRCGCVVKDTANGPSGT